MKTRVLVEQTFGQHKRRFYALHGELRVDPDKACACFTASAVLHNICKQLNMPDVDGDDTDDQVGENEPGAPVQHAPNARDLAMRKHLTDTFFT